MEAKQMKASDLRSALEARGVEIPTGSKKADLVALYTAPDPREAAIAELVAQRSRQPAPASRRL
jgi:hypothetical protein